jgi:hypothetical protein
MIFKFNIKGAGSSMAHDSAPDDIRCGCGRLLARRTSGRIEIKCRRCDRTITIDLDALPDDGKFVEQPPPR